MKPALKQDLTQIKMALTGILTVLKTRNKAIYTIEMKSICGKEYVMKI